MPHNKGQPGEDCEASEPGFIGEEKQERENNYEPTNVKQILPDCGYKTFNL